MRLTDEELRYYVAEVMSISADTVRAGIGALIGSILTVLLVR